MAKIIFNTEVLNTETDSKLEEMVGFLSQALDNSYYLSNGPKDFEYYTYLNGLSTKINSTRQTILDMKLWNKSLIAKIEMDKFNIITNLKPAIFEIIPVRNNKI